MVQESVSSPTIDEDGRRRFEAAWRSGEPTRLEDFLPAADHRYYVPTLEELILIQLENAWKSYRRRSESGEATLVRPASLDSYLKRFAVLNRPDIVERLAQQEYEVRLRNGDHPKLDEYRERYPQVTFTAVSDTQPSRGHSDKPPTIPGFEILSVLGQGGMGVVYKARQLALNRIVALKMILAGHAGAEELARFRVEAEALAQLQHPNIVQIYQIGEHEQQPFFLLEYAAGGSLAQATAGNPQDPIRAAHLTETLARAIHAAHLQGVIHRDLKPANVLLSREWRDESGESKTENGSLFTLGSSLSAVPKITDFGLAKRLHEDRGQTQTGQVMGTPSYMAPEQAAASGRAIGPACDVYALGALLYDLLTGRPPFKGATVLDTLDQVRSEEPVPPSRLQPKVPRDLETICLKCLEKEPRRRYATALDLAEDLRRLQAGEPIQARPVGRVERVVKWARRRPAAAAALGLLGLLILSVIGLNVWHSVDLADRLEEKTAEVNRLNDAKRLQTLSDKLDQLGTQANAALGREDWRTAGEALAQMLSMLQDEKELPEALVARRASVQHQAKELQDARARLRDFVHLRDEVLFQDTLLRDFQQGVDVARMRQTAQTALDLHGIDLATSSRLAYLSEQEQNEVREGVYQTLFVLAEVNAKEGDAGLQAALVLLDRAARVLPPSQPWHLRRARYLERRGDPAAASKERRRADAPVVSAFDHFMVGEDWYRQGNMVQAAQSFEAALQAQPNHYWSHYFLAMSCIQQTRPRLDLAKTHLTACLAQRRDVAWVYLLRAFTHSELGEFELANKDFAAALQRNPTKEARYGIHANWGVLHIRQAAALEPTTRLWTVAALVGDCAPAVTVATVAERLRQQQLAESHRELDAAIALAPDHFQAYITKAQAYQARWNLKAAVAEIDRALKVAPHLPSLWHQRGKLHDKHEEWTAALGDFRQALAEERKLGEKSPQVVLDNVEIGRVLFRLARYDEALQHCEAALAIRPDHAAAQRWRAEALLKLGRFRDAVEALDRYEVVGRLTPEVFVARGLAHEKLGEHAAALADFTRALGFGADANVFAHRGWVYLLAFDAPRLALDDFEQALKSGSQGGELFSGRGLARVQLGELTTAIEDADESLRRGPITSRLLYNTARIFSLAAGKLDTAGTFNPRTQETQVRYQKRAVQLIRQSLELLPLSSRQAFWRNYVQRDAALVPIVRTSDFAQLAAGYSRP